MKQTIQITTLGVALLFFTSSCTKNSALESTSSPSESAKIEKKLMNVLMYTREAYLKHDAHDYAEGHILEFHPDWKTQKAVNTLKIQNALTFMQQALMTGDTTGQYLNLFTYILPTGAVFMDTYPDSSLIFGNATSFTAFKTWFESTCTNWMSSHQCANIVKNTNTPKYILKIHCRGN